VAKSRLQRGLRSTLLGLVVNTVLVGIKFFAGFAGHSNALVADAVESLADIFSSLVVWRALIVSEAPADEDHPYGHGKAEPIASAVVASMLLLAAGWIVWQASVEIVRPHPSPAPFTLIVLLVVIAIKEALFRMVLRVSTTLESSAIQSDAWHHRSDAFTSLAAAIGISVSLVGGKGYESADDVAAVLAACVIAFNGYRLLRPALNELMDRSPGPDLEIEIGQIAESTPGVHCVEKCRVRKMGHHYYADMHLEVDPQMTVSRSHEIAHEVKARIQTANPRVRDVLIHIEPARAHVVPLRGAG
jgi:cation diffusion facilitator family transporter